MADEVKEEGQQTEETVKEVQTEEEKVETPAESSTKDSTEGV